MTLLPRGLAGAAVAAGAGGPRQHTVTFGDGEYGAFIDVDRFEAYAVADGRHVRSAGFFQQTTAKAATVQIAPVSLHVKETALGADDQAFARVACMSLRFTVAAADRSNGILIATTAHLQTPAVAAHFHQTKGPL